MFTLNHNPNIFDSSVLTIGCKLVWMSRDFSDSRDLRPQDWSPRQGSHCKKGSLARRWFAKCKMAKRSSCKTMMLICKMLAVWSYQCWWATLIIEVQKAVEPTVEAQVYYRSPNKSHDLIIVWLLLHIETGRNFETYVASIVGIEPSSSTQTSHLRCTTAWSTSSSFCSLVFSWLSATLSLLPSCTDLLVKILKNTENTEKYWKYWKMLKNRSWSLRGYLLLSLLSLLPSCIDLLVRGL